MADGMGCDMAASMPAGIVDGMAAMMPMMPGLPAMPQPAMPAMPFPGVPSSLGAHPCLIPQVGAGYGEAATTAQTPLAQVPMVTQVPAGLLEEDATGGAAATASMTQASAQAQAQAQMMQAQMMQAQMLSMQMMMGYNGMDSVGATTAGTGPATASTQRCLGGVDQDVGNRKAEKIDMFCERFHLDEKIRSQFVDAMQGRDASFEEDLARLQGVLEGARNPAGLLSVKIRELRDGTFGLPPGGAGGCALVGAGPAALARSPEMCGDFIKGICGRGDRCRFSHGEATGAGSAAALGGGAPVAPADTGWMQSEIQALVDRFSLDDRIRCRLAESMSRRMGTFQEDMRTLWEVLETARNPPGLLSVKLNEMEAGSFMPRGFAVSGISREEFCGDFRRGICTRGERCRFSHGGAGTPAATLAAAHPSSVSFPSAAAVVGGPGVGIGVGGPGGSGGDAGSGWAERKRFELAQHKEPGFAGRVSGMTSERKKELFGASSPPQQSGRRSRSRDRQREPSRSRSPPPTKRKGPRSESRKRQRQKSRSRKRSKSRGRSKGRKRSRSQKRSRSGRRSGSRKRSTSRKRSKSRERKHSRSRSDRRKKDRKEERAGKKDDRDHKRIADNTAERGAKMEDLDAAQRNAVASERDFNVSKQDGQKGKRAGSEENKHGDEVAKRKVQEKSNEAEVRKNDKRADKQESNEDMHDENKAEKVIAKEKEKDSSNNKNDDEVADKQEQMDKSKDRHKTNIKQKHTEKETDKGKKAEKDKKKNKTKAKEKDTSDEKDKGKHKKKEKVKECEKGKEKKNESIKEKGKTKDKAKEKDNIKDKEKEKERTEKGKEKSNAKDKARARPPSGSRSRDRGGGAAEDDPGDRRKQDKKKPSNKSRGSSSGSNSGSHGRSRGRRKDKKKGNKGRSRSRSGGCSGSSNSRSSSSRSRGRRKDTNSGKGRSRSRSKSQRQCRKASRSRSQERDSPVEIHHGVMCSGCRAMPIKGDRFKCSMCAKYNLCEKCYGKKHKLHAKDHRFYVQKAVAKSVMELKSTAPLSDSSSSSEERAESAAPKVPLAVTAAAALPPAAAAFPPTLGVAPSAAALKEALPAASAASVAVAAPPPPPAWLPAGTACLVCMVPVTEERMGVVCRRARPDGTVLGCGQGVCWACMLSTPRATFGDVRTTREEFEAMEGEGQAWWMHEACMERRDRLDYFGGHEEYAATKAAAAREEARLAQRQLSVQAQNIQDAEAVVERTKQQLQVMSSKQLREYLTAKRVDPGLTTEKAELLEIAFRHVAQVPAAALRASEPAWLPAGGACKLCAKTVKGEFGGVTCRRIRSNSTVGGCGASVCWRCMKRAARDDLGMVRCSREEFEALGLGAWWMHERCMTPQDREDYFSEIVGDE